MLLELGVKSIGDAVGFFRAGSAVKEGFRVKVNDQTYDVIGINPLYTRGIVGLKCALKVTE